MDTLTAHPAILAIAGYWLFSAFTGGMPLPDSTSSKAYRWLHDSLHILAGNLNSAVAAKYPNLNGTVQVTDTVQKTTTVVPASNELR